jgi:mRNA interferase HicA
VHEAADLLHHLSLHGCALLREGGNHSWWGNPGKNERSPVPRHKEVSEHPARKICKDLDIPKPRKKSHLFKS